MPAIPVYSYRFIEARNAHGPGFLQYTVPAGYTAVIKHMAVGMSGAVATQYVVLEGNLVQALDYFSGGGSGVSKVTTNWYHYVFAPGESFYVSFSDSTQLWAITVSGYLLSGAPVVPFPS